MRIRDWDDAGLLPRFAHQGQWLVDMLDRANAPDAAAFALPGDTSSDSGAAPADTARRFLVVTDLGLVDARYEPSSAGAPRLAAVLIAWADVRGVRLITETTVDEALRHVASWGLEIDEPAVTISDSPADAAVIELWRELSLRVGRPPREEPVSPD